MEIKWQSGDRSGVHPLVPGENHISIPAVKGTALPAIRAEVSVPPAGKMFFNGYQSWTHCPEYAPGDRIRGLQGLPKLITDLLFIDRFGDYHFVDYPWHSGKFHGVSYCYFRDGTFWRLFASLDEMPGYTLFSYDAENALLTITRDCEGVAAPGPTFPAFDLFYAEGTEQEVFDGWFDAMGIRNAPPELRGYSSWYNHYQNISERRIRDDLAGAVKLFEKGDLFQIDDGWETHVGDWKTVSSRKFPNGLEPLVRSIHHEGFKAGLWLAPFVCERNSAIFRKHRDWILRHKGKPWKAGPGWSGFYALDIDHPEVIRYLKEVFALVFEEWGFDLVKLDFLYAAAPFATGEHGDAGEGPYTESRAARMIRALDLLRELCRDRLIIGCGVPLMPAFGRVDYCRIGSDAGLDWDDFPIMRILHRERISTLHSLTNTIFRRQLNGRAFGNDPDIFFLRDKNIRLSAEKKAYHAAVNSLFGSLWLTSDDLNAYDAEKIRQYQTLARLRNAENITIDPDTLDILYTLDGKAQELRFPGKR